MNAPIGSIAGTLRAIISVKNSDEWWSNQEIVDLPKLMLIIFETLHLDCVALFAFDNFSNHHKYEPDALRANNLN